MAKTPAVGIDFGTTNSCIGVFQNGKVEIITNDYGNRITPSCVAFKYAEQLVGDSAKCQTTINLKNTISSRYFIPPALSNTLKVKPVSLFLHCIDFKGLIGLPYHDSNVKNDIKQKSFKVTNDKGKPKIQVEYKEGKTETFYSEEISSMVLMKMKQLAEAYLGKTVAHAVTTVPSYFNSLQRQSIKIAGTVAGFNVMRIINEPTAAGLAYAFHKIFKGERNVLVCDLGGANCNVSVLNIEDSICEVKATAGEIHLGGEEFNERMFNHLVLEFKKRYKKDLTSSKRAACRLRAACEKAKCTLSNSTIASIEIDYLYEGLDFYTSISRVQFEELNADLFCSIIRVIEKTLQDAKIGKTQIDEIILVGGSTRIPKIQELLQNYFNGKKLDQSINKDEGVACGAAIHAAILYGDRSKEIHDLLLLDVTPFSRGIKIASGAMATVIKRNTCIPTKQTDSFTDYSKNKHKLSLKVYEGENAKAKNNLLLGKFNLTDILPASHGVPEIDVSFSVCANNDLAVIVTEKATKKTMTFAVTSVNGHFSEEDVKHMKEKAEKYHLEEQNRHASAKNALT